MTEPAEDQPPEVQLEGAVEPSWESALTDGRQRFLAHVVVHGLQIGRRTAGDFIRHFAPHTIMEGLASAPQLRAAILTPSTGLKPRVALRKSWERAAEDLAIALEVGATSPDEIVNSFPPDDRIRHLDRNRLWSFVVEGDFWHVSASDREAHGRSRAHVAFMMVQALRDGLLTHRDIVEGVSVSEMANRLPRGELGRIITSALEQGHRAHGYTEKDLLDDMPPERLVEHLPLPHIWKQVIAPKIADVHGYAEHADGNPAATAPRSDAVETGWSTPPPTEAKPSKRQKKQSSSAG